MDWRLRVSKCQGERERGEKGDDTKYLIKGKVLENKNSYIIDYSSNRCTENTSASN